MGNVVQIGVNQTYDLVWEKSLKRMRDLRCVEIQQTKKIAEENQHREQCENQIVRQ